MKNNSERNIGLQDNEIDSTKNHKTRRAKGEGCLRQKPNGSWEAVPTIRKKCGVSISKSICRKDKREVLLLKAQLQALEPIDDDIIKIEIKGNNIILIRNEELNARNSNKHIDKDILVNEYVDYWLWEHRRKGMKKKRVVDNTFADYVQKCSHIKKKLGKEKVSDLTYNIIENALLEVHNETSDYTAIQVRNHIYNMMKCAKKEDKIIRDNPLEDKEINFCESKKKKEKKVILQSDEDKVIEYCIINEFYDVLVALFTGARASELAGMTWDNIDFDNCTITIEKEYMAVKQYEFVNGNLECIGKTKRFTDLKSKSSYRTLGIPEEIIICLKNHKSNQKSLAQKLDKKFTERDFIFTSCRYNPYDRDDFYDRVKKVVTELKIKNWQEISTHCLRHTYCSTGVKNKVPLADMQRLLGHEDVSVTANWYTHFDTEYLLNSAKDVNKSRLSAFKKLPKKEKIN